jgi:hypothetical protein
MAEQIPSDHVGLNLKHFRYLEVLLIGVAETLKADTGKLGTREVAEIAGIIEKCQRGRRLARGLSAGGEAEEEVRARAEAENRALVGTFVDAVKEHVPDEIFRETIHAAIMARFPGAAGEELEEEAPPVH